jgi:peptidyl-prolyl cis-trans isomerase D
MLEVMRKLTTGWPVKIILGLIVVPFALWGIDSYLNQAGRDVAVAKVGGDKISIQEYGNAMENVRTRMLSEGQKVDSALLDSPLFKQSVLDGLITRRLMNAEIRHANFKISDAQLSEHILAMPEFQEKGKFSEELYQKTLEQNKLSPSRFESSIRNDMLTQQAREGLARLVMLPPSQVAEALKITHQKRDVSTAEIKVASLLSQVKVTPEEVKAYYEAHKDKFVSPEQVKLQFALLSANGLVPQVSGSVTDAEVKESYEANKDKIQSDEQRHASHILIGFGVTAKESDKAAAKAKAEDILAQLKKNPKKFEELATKFSQDPGSASKGGDLGSFGRGAMVKPFEDAVFSMKVGQISDLVQSDYGYHIIRLDGISGTAINFDELKPQVKADLIFQKALAKYAELTEEFSNMAYEQSGSLDPLAKKFNLQLQTTGWLSREDGAKYFKNDKLMAQVFSDEVLKNKRNTEAVEVSANNLISARVLEYKPSAPRSFDEVKGGIEALLKLEAASKLAKEKGEAALAKLSAGEKVTDLEWISPVTVDRKTAQGLPDTVMQHVFKIGTGKLPAYGGFLDPNKSYTLIQISRIDDALGDEETKKEAEHEINAAMASEYINAYGKSLKAKADITINRKLLENKEPQ